MDNEEVQRQLRVRRIKTRMLALRDRMRGDLDELNGLLAELEKEETPEERRRRFKVIEGGFLLLGAIMSTAAGWSVKHSRAVAGFVVAAGGAAALAVSMLALGAPRGSAPPRSSGPLPSASTSVSASSSPARATPSPSRRRLPVVPIGVVPSRMRRTPAPSRSSATPAGPPPSLSRSPRPTPTPSPTPVVSGCPVGLTLKVLALGVTICV